MSCKTEKQIAVMAAYVNGEKIEYAMRCTNPVFRAYTKGEPLWDWNTVLYRVKKEPRRVWMNVYPNGDAHNFMSLAQANACRSYNGKTIMLEEKEA